MLPKVHSQVSLFELDEEETAAGGGKGSTWSTSMSDAAALSTLRGVLTHEAGLQIQRDVERARRQACGGGESTASVEALALALSNMGYDYVRVRRATGGGAGASCLRNLRHSFLLVAAPGDRDHTPFVVDPDFAEQFLIAKPTPRYSAFLSILSDSALVIPEDHITALVSFLCAELAAAFRETNTVLPPWRLATSMLSKWTSRASIDEVPRACRREDGGSSGEAAHVFRGSGAAAEAEPMRGIFVSAPRHSSGAVAMEPIRVIGGFSRMSYILA